MTSILTMNGMFGKTYQTTVLMTILLLTGCSEYGGGASLVPEVTFLPEDFGGAASETVAGNEPAVAPGTQPSAGSGPGSFAGRVVLSGTAPGLPLLFVQGADIKDKEVCAATDMPDERLVLGADNGVANVFVFMKKAPKGASGAAPPNEPIFFDQKNCRFLPRSMIVPVGQTVKVLSDDPIAHNTHTNPAKNNGVSSLVPPNDREGVLELMYTRAEDPFSVTCDFHAWMKAYHLPLDHPYGAVTDQDGKFEISNIPAGKHEFIVWHESAAGNYVERKLVVTIKPGETTSQDIEYAADKLAL